MKQGDIVAWSLINGWSLVKPNGYFPKWEEVTAYWRIKSLKPTPTKALLNK